MNYFDITVLVVVGVGIVMGFRNGLLMEIVSFVSIFVAIVVSINFKDVGADFLSNYIVGYDKWLPSASFVIILISAVVLMNTIGKLIKKTLDLTLIGSLDDLAGALFGGFKLSLIISSLLWIYESCGGQFPADIKQDSLFLEPVVAIAPFMLSFLADIFPIIGELTNDYNLSN